MEFKRISNRVYYLSAEERTDRPVLGCINGDKYSLAVDAGNSSDHVGKFYEELRSLDLRLPDFTVITHWHWDHTFGMHSAAGKTVACRLTNQKLGEMQKWEWTNEAMERRLQSGEDIEFADRCIKLEYPDRNKIKIVKAGIEFNGEIDIDLGGIHCEIREFVAPHSNDSVLVYVPEERVVFIGDADCEDFYQNNREYDIAKLKEMMNFLNKIDFDILVEGHDLPRTKLEFMDILKGELDRSSG
jgi:glyoxylase-like metal-dependent hydrolase (beta-lactamase superfamily II)